MKLERDERVRSWIRSYSSYNVKSNKGYALEAFLRSQDLTINELFAMPDEEVRQAVNDVVREYVAMGKGPFARNVVDSVKSLLLFNDRDVRLGTFRHLRKGTRIGIQLIPKAVDVYRMAEEAGRFSLRNRALILCLFQSGVRPNCITKWTYGMTGDALGDGDVPICLIITKEMDTKLPSYGLDYYRTFLGREASQALSDYQEERRSEGWMPKREDLVFVTAGPSAEMKGRRLTVGHLDEMIKRVARRSGIDPARIWPYSLRKAFRKVINNSPIDEDTREALMGHTLPGSRTNYFDYHDVEEIARKYAQADFSSDSGSQLDAVTRRLDEVERRLSEEIRTLNSRVDVLQSDLESPSSRAV